MQIDPSIYSEFLRIQADNSFSQETVLYRRFPVWKNARTVLDFGCGNGHYTNLLAAKFPDKAFIGIEKDERLFEIAIRNNALANVRFVLGSFEDSPEELRFDFVVLRFVASYIPDRQAFWKWLTDKMGRNAGLLVIDADDDNFYFEPEMSAFMEEIRKFYERVEREGGKRDIIKSVADELNELGFEERMSMKMVISSDWPGRREPMFLYIYLGTEVDTGPLPAKIHEELHAWALDRSSYIQYGQIGRLFVREN
jgi:trans-aconitate methyltransferase